MVGRTIGTGLDRFAGDTHGACPVGRNRSLKPRLLSYHAAAAVRSPSTSRKMSIGQRRQRQRIAAPPLNALPEVSELRSAAEQFVDALDADENEPAVTELNTLQNKIDAARQEVRRSDKGCLPQNPLSKHSSNLRTVLPAQKSII